MNAPFVLSPADGRHIDMSLIAMTVEAAAEDTDGAFTLLEATEPPGFGLMHIHHDAAEAFYVLDGEYTIFIDDREVVCPTAHG